MLSNAYNNMEDAFREDDQPDKWDITAQTLYYNDVAEEKVAYVVTQRVDKKKAADMREYVINEITVHE